MVSLKVPPTTGETFAPIAKTSPGLRGPFAKVNLVAPIFALPRRTGVPTLSE